MWSLDKYKSRIPKYVGHSDLVLRMCLDLGPIQICVKFEGSTVNHIDRRCKYRKKDKWLGF